MEAICLEELAIRLLEVERVARAMVLAEDSARSSRFQQFKELQQLRAEAEAADTCRRREQQRQTQELQLQIKGLTTALDDVKKHQKTSLEDTKAAQRIIRVELLRATQDQKDLKAKLAAIHKHQQDLLAMMRDLAMQQVRSSREVSK